MPSVARVKKDVGKDLLNVTTNKTVFIGDQPWAVATEGTVSVLGDVVVASTIKQLTEVFHKVDPETLIMIIIPNG